MKSLKSITFFGVLLFTISGANAQSARKINTQIAEYMESVRNKTEHPGVSDLFQNQKNHEAIYNSLTVFIGDSTYEVRQAAYRLTYEVAFKSQTLALRQLAVERITKGTQDNNRSIAGWSARHLSVFNREDFTLNAKANISTSINTGAPRLSELIKVAGYLNITEAENTIRTIAQTSRKTSDKLASYLALARMGNQDYANRITNLVRKQELNDDVVYELIPGLVYTRQKTCIDFVIEVLYNDEKKCISSDPDNPVKIQCGYRVMEYLAPVIKDFPYGVKTSGDIDAEDYPEALERLREWFLSEGKNYEIIDDKF